MCDNCAYKQGGYCSAPDSWWKYDTEDGSCALFIDKEDTTHVIR